MLFLSQATLEMKGVKEMKALLDILELDFSVHVRIQVWSILISFHNQGSPFVAKEEGN